MAADPHELVDLMRANNELQAVSLIAELEAHGIPAKAFSTGIMQYQMPMSQPQRVLVRRSDLGRAREVLREFEPMTGEDFDWESVDTGDESPLGEEETPPRFVCARCGYSREGLPRGSFCPECNAPPAQRYELAAADEGGGIAQYLLWVVVGAIAILLLLGLVL